LSWLDVTSESTWAPGWDHLERASWLGSLRHLGIFLGMDTNWEDLACSDKLAGLRSLELTEPSNWALEHLGEARHLRPSTLTMNLAYWTFKGQSMFEFPAMANLTRFALEYPRQSCDAMLGHFATPRPVCQPFDFEFDQLAIDAGQLA